MWKELKSFIFRGDVIALSTGVIVGGAFGEIVQAIIKGLITPLLTLLGGNPNINLGFEIHQVKFELGLILSAIIGFLITACVIFFFIVKPSQKVFLKMKEPAAAPTTPEDIVLLREIRDLLKK